MFGLGIGFGFQQPRSPVDAPAASTITALAIHDATQLDQDGGGVGIDGNGWVAKAILPYDSAATFDPNKIVLTVSDPGFDSDGSATTRTRTIRGGEILRRQYPNRADFQASEVSGNLEVYFSLSDDVFAGSTITVAEAEAGYYGDDAAGSIAGVVNSSTKTYPKPLFGWLNLQHERATGTHFAVEAVAYHAMARLGAQVACIEFTAEDASANATAAVRASAPALSDFQTQGQRVEAWKASIPLAALTQAELCNVNAVVKPWIGDAWDLETNEVAWPTPSPQTRLRFLNDKAGSYGGALAFVSPSGNNTTGVVSLTEATARANPFLTWNAAVAALPAFNNTNRGHNNHSGGTIYLMDDGVGGAADHAQAATLAAVTAGECWTDIRVDPAATGAVRIIIGANKVGCDLLRFLCPIYANASFIFDSGNSNANIRIALDGASVTHNGGALPAVYRYGLVYQRNVTFDGTLGDIGMTPFKAFSSTRHHVVLSLGSVMTGATVNMDAHPFVMIGCDFRRTRITESNAATTPNQDAPDGMIVANNKLLDVRSASEFGVYRVFTRGMAIVQNALERAVASTAVQALSISEGILAASNVLVMHNTIPGVDGGGRFNWLYTDDASVQGVAREGVARFNLFHQYNVKSDTFTAVSLETGRVSNWRLRYGVSCAGNVSVDGDSNSGTAPDPSGATWLGEHWEPGSEPYSGTVAFVDNKSGTAGAGGGDYSLTGATNDAYDRVPAGLQALSFDLAGGARVDDGSGAAGAYERA